MSDTYEAFYNGKPLNPNRGLPTMSYAQAEDCGLTDSERLWCRTDGDGTVITADEVPYDSNNSVKDKIDGQSSAIRTLQIVNTKIYFNVSSITFDVGYVPSTSKGGTGYILNGNRGLFAIFKIDSTSSITRIAGSDTLTISRNESEITITSSGTLWGTTELHYVSN